MPAISAYSAIFPPSYVVALLTTKRLCMRRCVDVRRCVFIMEWTRFYRAMHFSAKRGIAIARRLSVCPSVCDVGEL